MNDMLSGGPALPGRSALEQMGDTNDPVEISDGEAKAVTATVMASAMATDRAADGEAGEAKVNMLPAPYPTPRLRWIPGKDRFSSVTSLLPHDHPLHSYQRSSGLLVDDGRRAEPVLARSQRTAGAARIVPFLCPAPADIMLQKRLPDPSFY